MPVPFGALANSINGCSQQGIKSIKLKVIRQVNMQKAHSRARETIAEDPRVFLLLTASVMYNLGVRTFIRSAINLTS